MYVCVCVSRARMQGEALMWTLADGLGDKFTEEVRVVLQCVAVCCRVLPCVAVWAFKTNVPHLSQTCGTLPSY